MCCAPVKAMVWRACLHVSSLLWPGEYL
jgi:hypothetical protein